MEKGSIFERFGRIGMFDSGVGGLSVLSRLAALPGQRQFVYLGDTARCPYGNREAAEISEYVEQIVYWLLKQDVEAIIMACNTSAAVAFDVARRVSSVPVFDLIRPTAAHVASGGRKVGVMATNSTAKSRAFTKAIQDQSAQAAVVEYGCPELVPIVEGGSVDADSTLVVLRSYVDRCLSDGVQELILGCTHFPFLRRQIERLAAGKITVVDPADVLTDFVQGQGKTSLDCRFYVTGDVESFHNNAARYLGQTPSAVHHVSIEQLNVITLMEELSMSSSTMPSHVVPVVQ